MRGPAALESYLRSKEQADEGAGSKWKHAVRRRDLRVRERAKRALEEVEKATKRTRRLLHGAGGEEEE